MALTVIPEASTCRFGDFREKSLLSCIQEADEISMNVKHTFIEIVAKPRKLPRVRSFTDSELLVAEEFSDVSTDTPSDEEVGPGAPTPAVWESPCFGPSSDHYYSNDLQNDISLASPDNLTWGLPCLGSQFWPNPMLLEQWPLYTDIDVASDSCASAPLAYTTVMLRNLPSEYSRSHLMQLLEDEGFEGSYDLVYVPMDFQSQSCLGYGFVNLMAASDAARCWTVFDKFVDWGIPSENVCEVIWSDPHQGTQALIERYRNSPVMHHSIPDEWKPAFFADGVKVPFPEPTDKIKAPKLKSTRSKKNKQLE